MNNLTIAVRARENEKPQRFVNNQLITPGMSLVIKPTIDKKTILIIEVINPFNLVVFSHRFEEGKVSFKFANEMPSGVYFFKVQSYKTIEENNEKNDKCGVDYYSVNFLGKFKNKEWFLTYAVNCSVFPGLEIRIAIPKENFPFIMLNGFEGKPVEVITTDLWSNWLVFDTRNLTENTGSITFGYRSEITLNYMIFSSDALLDKEEVPNDYLKFLKSEEGIETNDKFIIDFSKNILATTTLGIVFQTLSSIKEHLTFKNQVGEFGAKYALLNRQGDCTEFSALFVALCRIKKIPARLVAGLKFDSLTQTWGRHAWAEFYYNGIFIPVDTVEGYLIGQIPDLIPLFKGNWIAEEMQREVKISISPEFVSKITPQQLIAAYRSLNITYKVYSKENSPVELEKTYDVRSTFDFNFHVVKKQKKNKEYSYELDLPFNEKYFIIFIYYQLIGSKKQNKNNPKIVYKIVNISQIGKNFNVPILCMAPSVPAQYEQGIIITTRFGQLLLWEKSFVMVD